MTLGISWIGHVAGYSSSTTVTTGSADTSGAAALVAWAKFEGGATTSMTVSDNKGNTWTALTQVDHTNNDLSSRMFYCLAPTVGAGHTITLTLGAARPYQVLGWWSITASGAVSLDASAQAQGNDAVCDAGTLTTTAASASALGVGGYTFVDYTPSTGWTESAEIEVESCADHRTDASATTINPSVTATSTQDFCANAASFIESAGAASTVHRNLMLGVGI